MVNNKTSSLKQRRNRTTRTGDRDHLPLPSGRYAKVAYRDIMVGYSRKSGCLVRLFYPHKADTGGGEHNALLWKSWLPHPAYQQGLLDVGNLRSKVLISLLRKINKENIFIPAIQDGRPLVEKGIKYPAIVFSHGLGGFRNMNAALCTELASHGFVVAAVEHRDNSACLSFYARNARYSLKNSNPDFYHDMVDGVPSGDAEDEVDFGDELDDPNYIPPPALEPMSSDANYLELQWVRHRFAALHARSDQVARFRNRQIHQRVRECSRALDVLEALNAGYESLNNLLDPKMNVREFEGLIDMEKLIIMGHSMGGATALMSAAAELRFKVIVALDPWMYPLKDESLDLITQPAIMINTETLVADKANKAKLEEMMSVVEGDDPERRKAWTLNGSSHTQQCDAPYVFSSLALWLSGFPFGRLKMRHITAHDLTARLAMQFIAKQLDIEIDNEVTQYLEEEKDRMRPTYKN